MRSMSLTAEQIAKNELEILRSPDEIRVRVKVSWDKGFCLPDENGEREEEAVFKTLTFGDNYAIEKACAYTMPVAKDSELPDGMEMPMQTQHDIQEMRRLFVRRNLLRWTLDIPIERVDGWMTSECYAMVSRISAPLMDAFLDGFEDRTIVTKEEEETINKQSLTLFSKHSRGVADACEAIRLFCTLGNFWEKFGLDRFDIPDLPYREYALLKMMTAKESEAMRRQSKAAKTVSNTKIIAGHGGKARPSQGIVIPEG